MLDLYLDLEVNYIFKCESNLSTKGGINRKNLGKLLHVMEVPNQNQNRGGVRSATASQSGSASFFGGGQSFDIGTYVNKIILWIRNHQFTIIDVRDLGFKEN